MGKRSFGQKEGRCKNIEPHNCQHWAHPFPYNCPLHYDPHARLFMKQRHNISQSANNQQPRLLSTNAVALRCVALRCVACL
eukprot:scaffold4662_cov51-Attheya_sp.AAC.1